MQLKPAAANPSVKPGTNQPAKPGANQSGKPPALTDKQKELFSKVFKREAIHVQGLAAGKEGSAGVITLFMEADIKAKDQDDNYLNDYASNLKATKQDVKAVEKEVDYLFHLIKDTPFIDKPEGYKFVDDNQTEYNKNFKAQVGGRNGGDASYDGSYGVTRSDYEGPRAKEALTNVGVDKTNFNKFANTDFKDELKAQVFPE